MMHLHMIGLGLLGAIAVRIAGYLSLTKTQPHALQWQTRWNSAIVAFVAPPLLLIATTVAIVSMGASTGYHPWEGQLSYVLSSVFIAGGLFAWLSLGISAAQMRASVNQIPLEAVEVEGRTLALGRVLDVSTIFSAQVGLWSSDLVISRGLLEHLDTEHLSAVLAHESGHAHYRDTFWFFWLGGLYRFTAWLPYSSALWQELLLLREIRADRWAARSVDALVLAESLMRVITAPLMSREEICPSFSCAAPRSRLSQRIDALLASEDRFDSSEYPSVWQWCAIGFSLMPLLTIPFHH